MPVASRAVFNEGDRIMFKLCIVGCGGIATLAHLPAIEKYTTLHPDTVLVACADINESRALAAKERYEIPNAYTNIDLMLAAEHPDAVLCLVPEGLIAQVSCDIMRKGYPVMLEKPPGETLAQVRTIAETSATCNVPHMVAFNRRFSPLLAQLRQQVATKKVLSIDYTMERVARTENHFESTVIHAVDAVISMAGRRAKQVEIRYQELPHLGEKVANFYLYFTFDATPDAAAMSATVRIYPYSGCNSERATVYTEDAIWQAQLPEQSTPTAIATDFGYLREYVGNRIKTEWRGERFTGLDHAISNGFYGELAYFIDCIKSGTYPAHSAETCYQSVIVCELMKHRVTKYLFEV